MEGVYANLDAVPGEKRRENLRTATDDAVRSKELATIDRHLDIDVDFDGLVAAPPDRSSMKELFRKLELRAILKRLDELEEAVPGAPAEVLEGVEIDWREGDLADVRALARRRRARGRPAAGRR